VIFPKIDPFAYVVLRGYTQLLEPCLDGEARVGIANEGLALSNEGGR
jgi:hypothetical protein